MKKFGIVILLFILIGVGVFAGSQVFEMLGQRGNLPAIPQVPTLQVGEQEQHQIAPAIPQSLRISKINVETVIEHVGMDAQGRMDVPKDADNVAWYSLRYKPGENGNAVLAGHYDKVSGEPAVFWSVGSLAPGDTIVVEDEDGKEYTFSVTKVNRYPYDNFPIEEVFGPSSKPMLNLITCQGSWDDATQNYSHRVVVYSQMK